MKSYYIIQSFEIFQYALRFFCADAEEGNMVLNKEHRKGIHEKSSLYYFIFVLYLAKQSDIPALIKKDTPHVHTAN